MMKQIRRLTALVLGLCMLFGTAQGAGLSTAVEGYLGEASEVAFRMSARLERYLPFGDDTVDMFNSLLEHMSISGSVKDGGAQTKLTFTVRDEDVVSLTESVCDSGTELVTSLLPERVLVSAGSAMDVLSGTAQQQDKFDFYTARAEAENCYRELAEAIQPFAEDKEASYSIQNVGSARWVRLARLPPEQSAEVQPYIAKVLGCGMDEAFREQLEGMTCQKNFTVAVYKTKRDGDDMAVYIKGNVIFPDGQQRAINYQWAFGVNSKGQRVDTYKFEMTKSTSPRDNRTITVTSKQIAKANSLLVDVVSKAIIRDPETAITTTTTVTHKLNGENGTVKGTSTHVVRDQKGETTSTATDTYTPSLKIVKNGEKAVITGSVKIEHQQGQNVQNSLELLFGEPVLDETAEEDNGDVSVKLVMPPSSLTQNVDWDTDDPEDFLVGKPPIGYTDHEAPAEETVVDLDYAQADETAALMDELVQNLAGSLLRAAAKLPEEATALLRDGLSEADWAAFLALLEE